MTMKRSFQRIYELVSSIQPLDPLEEEHITFTLNWIKCAPQIFRIEKPAIPNIHLVSYFVLIDQERTQILLGDHKKSGLWLPAGGHVELDEHPAETVKREAKEELSIIAQMPCQNCGKLYDFKTRSVFFSNERRIIWWHGRNLKGGRLCKYAS